MPASHHVPRQDDLNLLPVSSFPWLQTTFVESYLSDLHLRHSSSKESFVPFQRREKVHVYF